MNGLVYAYWIRLRFHQFRVQHALVIYTLLPVRIMTSTLVAVYFASCSISKRGHPRMASISLASFSALHSSVRYLIFLYTLLVTVYFVVSRRCMMQPIIFLLLIVVRLT
jgi:hypothetical protein